MSQDDDDLKTEIMRATSPEFRLAERIEKLDARVEASEEDIKRRAEETQRNIDFIIQQQAQFAADMQQLRAAQAEADEKWERRWGRTEEGIRSLLAIAEIHEGEIKALAEAQALTAEAQAAQAEAQAQAQARTDKQMAETDGRLNTLINVVERIISEKRNGGQDETRQ
ncbi:MAG TPA: hypothetical protein VJT82_12195 [Pyrinomonadaceae bacterium]|nr:hypothetical protein [Pyrinomonadaceae bacterium]